MAERFVARTQASLRKKAIFALNLAADVGNATMRASDLSFSGEPTAFDLPKYLLYRHTRSHHIEPSIPIRSRIGASSFGIDPFFPSRPVQSSKVMYSASFIGKKPYHLLESLACAALVLDEISPVTPAPIAKHHSSLACEQFARHAR